MGVIKHLNGEFIPEGEKCHICGENTASGYWIGSRGAFCVCSGCAKAILPILIADSLEYIPNTSNTVSAFEHVEKVFWKAAYFRAVFNDKNEHCSYSLPQKDK